MDSYFGMDSFNRNNVQYCCNVSGVDESELRSLSKAVMINSTVDSALVSDISADRVKMDGMSVGDALRKICERLTKLERKENNVSSALVFSRDRVLSRLARKDLNLVWTRQ